MVNRISDKRLSEAKRLVLIKLDSKSSATISMKNGATAIIVNPSGAEDGWFLYLGCELVVGDTVFEHVVYQLCIQSDRSKDDLEAEFGSFIGGN